MSQLPNPFGINRSHPLDYAGPENPALVKFFNSVYAWMCVGLGVTAVVSYLVAQSGFPMRMGTGTLIGLFAVQIALVLVIGNAINRINATAATALFVLYAALNGVTMSFIFLIYTHATIASAFIVSAATFGATSVYGMTTSRDLSGMRRILMTLLFGVIIASVVSVFWHNTAVQVILNYVGVLVFVGLTAYHTQMLKEVARQTEGKLALAARLSVVGALKLYLDFINIFLFILRLMGNSDRR